MTGPAGTLELPVVLCGAGGHAKVLLEALRAAGREVLGACVPDPTGWRLATLCLGDDAWLRQQTPGRFELVNGVGSTGDPRRRIAVFDGFKAFGFSFARVVHPGAIVASDAVLAEGVQVMAGAVIQPGCHLGENALVNTRSSLDHDGNLGAHVHLAPGAIICGGVTVGARSHVGPGATLVHGVSVGVGCLVGAGSLVLHSLPDNVMAYGVPARVVKDMREVIS